MNRNFRRIFTRKRDVKNMNNFRAANWVDLPEDVNDSDEVLAFDAEICKSGLKKFMRRLTDRERREASAVGDIGNADAVVITEIEPGIRTRIFVFRIGEG